MIEKSLMKAYRQSRHDLEDAKNVLRKACDSVRSAKFPLMQSLLDECYPDLHLSVKDMSTDDFSMDYMICVPIPASMGKKEEIALHEDIYNKIMQSLEYIENMEEREL